VGPEEDRIPDREAARRERSEPHDPNLLRHLVSAFPRPSKPEDKDFLRIKLNELGSGWNSHHHQFWDDLPLHMARSPKLMFEILEVLLDRIKDLEGPTIEELDPLISPLIYCAHAMNNEQIANSVGGFIDEEKRKDPSIIGYQYAQVLVEFFNTDRLLFLEHRSPREALFFAELMKVRALLKLPNDSQEEDGVEENSEDHSSDQHPTFPDCSLREQLEFLAHTTLHGGFFIASCSVSEEFANQTFNWLLDRFLGDDKAARRASGGLICHILAEDPETHEIFISQIKALLVECDDQVLPRLARLLGVAGILADENGRSRQRSRDRGGLATEERFYTLKDHVSEMCRDLVQSYRARNNSIGSVLIAHLSLLDSDYCPEIEELLYSELSSVEGVEKLQKIAASGEMFAEALGLAGVPGRSLELLEENNSYNRELRRLLRTILCGSHRSFDLIHTQFIDMMHELEDFTANWTSNTIHAGYRAAKVRGEETALDYLRATLSTCAFAINLNLTLRWPTNEIGVIRTSSIVFRLLKASEDLHTAEPILSCCKNISGLIESLYERTYLQLGKPDKDGKFTENVTDEDVLAKLPKEVVKLQGLLDEVLAKSSPF